MLVLVLSSTDLRTLLEAIKFCRKVAESQPIAPFVVGPHDPPASSVSDDDFLAWVPRPLSVGMKHV